MEIHYEKHPITQQRKAELLKAGKKIIDARFKPKEPKKRGRPAKKDD